MMSRSPLWPPADPDRAQPHLPERQVDVVGHHQQVGRRVDIGLAHAPPAAAAPDRFM